MKNKKILKKKIKKRNIIYNNKILDYYIKYKK